jgi:hypothetical protein
MTIHTLTFFNKANYSILDLAICSSDLYSNFDSFSCLDGFSLGSDHIPIQIKININVNKQEISNSFTTNWENFKNNLSSEFPQETIGNVNEMNKFISDDIIKAYNNSTTSSVSPVTKMPKYINILINI